MMPIFVVELFPFQETWNLQSTPCVVKENDSVSEKCQRRTTKTQLSLSTNVRRIWKLIHNENWRCNVLARLPRGRIWIFSFFTARPHYQGEIEREESVNPEISPKFNGIVIPKKLLCTSKATKREIKQKLNNIWWCFFPRYPQIINIKCKNCEQFSQLSHSTTIHIWLLLFYEIMKIWNSKLSNQNHWNGKGMKHSEKN